MLNVTSSAGIRAGDDAYSFLWIQPVSRSHNPPVGLCASLTDAILAPVLSGQGNG